MTGQKTVASSGGSGYTEQDAAAAGAALLPPCVSMMKDCDRISEEKKERKTELLHIENDAFEERFLRTLNPQQREAVTATDGSILLLATPGSGKTTVLVTRLGYMICSRGIEAESILTMTYTRAATRDMKARFAGLFGEDAAERLQFRTINGVSAKIIERYCVQYHRTAFALLDNEMKLNTLVRGIYQQLNREYAEDSIVRDIRTQITYVKNQMLTGEEIRALSTGIDHFPELYQAYQEELRRSACMDYDDQMVYALSILRRHPELLRAVQDQFPYVCVDEAQDTSKIQHEIIRLLSERHGNLFMVGDEDQSIYGFRAAYPEALLRFEQDHPGARILFMEENYRSTPEIIYLANSFIAQNLSRREKTIRPTRSSGSPVHVLHCADRRAQYQLLLEMARSCKTETAVLFRNNDSALPLIDLFERNGISYNYRKTDGLFFFTHRVVGDLLSILQFAYEPANAELFLRLYYKFDAKISKKEAMAAVKRSEQSGRPILEELLRVPELKSYVRDAVKDLLENLPQIQSDGAETAICRIWEGMHYRRYVEQKGYDAGKFFILCMLARDVPSVPAFLEKLETLKTTIEAHRNHGGNQVLLSTIHSSKGLEYDRVYLLDILNGILPAKPEHELETEEEGKLYEEDRRLYYVAMTRARNELYLFRCKAPSEFTQESCDALSAPASDEEDIFHFLDTPQIGKRYTDREWGPGVITAQCDDRFSICFGDGTLRTLTLEQMVLRREKTVRKRAPTGKREWKSPIWASVLAQRIKEQMEVGKSVEHKVFGSGVIQSISNGILTIKFKDGEAKRFVLQDVIARGLLRL